MTRIGYARVSSRSQSLDDQTAELRAHGCEIVRAEKESGKSLDRRDELETILQFLRPGDELIVTRLDRLGRSLSDLLNLSKRILDARANLIVLYQKIDLGTPAGRLFFQVLGMIAEFERELILERQAIGIAKAKAEGKMAGRKPSIDRSSVRDLLAVKPSIGAAEIARRLKIAPASVYRIVDELSRSTA